MIFSFNYSNANKRILVKRINRQLVAHFFTIEEFKTLSNRKSFKVIKYISKIENIKLTKKEIKGIIFFIKNDFDFTTNPSSAIKLWDFVIDYIEEKKIIKNDYLLFNEDRNIIRYFRFNKFDLLRI